MIRVCHILTPVTFGGSERVILTYLKNTDRSRFDTHAILLYRPWEEESTFAQELKKVHCSFQQVPVALRPASEGRDFLRVVRCFNAIYSILKGGSFDLVHTHGYFADIVGIPASRLLGISCLSTCHGYINTDVKLKIYNGLDLAALRFANAILSVSDEIRELLIGSRIPENRIRVVRNAVEPGSDNGMFLQYRETARRALGVGEEEWVLGFIGRLSEEKGCRYLLEAANRLARLGLPVKLLIIGDGPQKGEAERWVHMKDLQERTVFTGFQKEVNQLIPAMDVFILPSLTEGTPMALLEAMACGLPVIASAVGGVPQIIDSGANGILVPPGDPDAIASAVRRLFNDGETRRRLASRAKETVSTRFDVKAWVEEINAVYTEMVNHSINRCTNADS